MRIRSLDHNLSLIETLEINLAEDALSLYPAIVGFRFNYVISETSTASPISSIHTSPIDRLILKTIRMSADLVVTTGLTARLERLSAPATTPFLILTRESTLVVPATMSPSKVPVTGSLADYLERLKLEYPSIALEVGLRTAKELAAQQLLDEVCLTITGVTSGRKALAKLAGFLNSIGFTGKIQHTLNLENTWLFRVIATGNPE